MNRQHSRHLGLIGSLPMVRGKERTRLLSEEADYILEMLIKAGLTDPKKRFIHNSSLRHHLSRPMMQRLKWLDCEVRKLKSLALAKVRTIVTQRCNGIRFLATVNSLEIPVDVKEKLTFSVPPELL